MNTPRPMTTGEIERTLEKFADAQRRGDGGALGQLVTDDFKLVGPLGFVVPKAQSLERFDAHTADRVARLGRAQHQDLRLPASRDRDREAHPDRHLAQTLAGGQFRVTAIALRDRPRWRLAGAPYSRVADPGSQR